MPKAPSLIVLATPVIFGISGYLADLAAKYLPGHPHLDKSGLAAVFIAAGVFVVAHAALLVHHLVKNEAPARPPASRRVAAKKR